MRTQFCFIFMYINQFSPDYDPDILEIFLNRHFPHLMVIKERRNLSHCSENNMHENLKPVEIRGFQVLCLSRGAWYICIKEFGCLAP